MKRILFFLISFFYISSGHALPDDCGHQYNPYNWHNCVGAVLYGNGNKYEGWFVEGLPHGRGTLYFLGDIEHINDKYVGEFKKGLQHGQGAYYYLTRPQSKGDVYVGEWKDDKSITSRGTYKWANGDKNVEEF